MARGITSSWCVYGCCDGESKVESLGNDESVLSGGIGRGIGLWNQKRDREHVGLVGETTMEQEVA